MIPSFRKLQDDMSRARDRRKERLRRKRAKAGRRSLLEQLEDRRVMAMLTVTTGDDTVNASDGVLSLREAIATANSNNEPDVIKFAANVGTVSIGESQPQLTIDASTDPPHKVTIQGPATIKLSDQPIRVRKADQNVEFVGLEITGATKGAIVVEGSSVVIRDSTFHGNDGEEGRTGGVIKVGHDYSRSFQGVYGGDLTMISSTISNNTHKGMYVAAGATALVVNSTITNNGSFGEGVDPGLYFVPAGGIQAGYEQSAGGRITLHNSIVAGNHPNDIKLQSSVMIHPTSSNNLVGTLSARNCYSFGVLYCPQAVFDGLLETTVLKNGTNNNTVGVDVSKVIDTTLKRKSGGETFTSQEEILTHALVDGSPAIDAGNATYFAFEPLLDQQGSARIAGEGIDIGAVERYVPDGVVTVSNELDYAPGATPIEGSLRWAIDEVANKSHNAVTIAFAPSVHKISPTSLLVLSETGPQNKTTIRGPVTIDLSNHPALLKVNVGVYAQFFGLEITGSKRLASVVNEGHLEIHSSTIHGNSDNNDPDFGGKGGAIHSDTGKLTIVNSTISDNTAPRNGSAVYVGSGSASIVNSTIVNNRVTNATEAGDGGAVFAEKAATLVIHNSIIAGNLTTGLINGHQVSNFSQDLAGTISSESSNNLVSSVVRDGSVDPAAGLKNGERGNIVGNESQNIVVGTVIDTTLKRKSGGATFTGLEEILTHALVGDKDSNKAIDGGEIIWFDSSRFTDQIGAPRISGEGVDIGAVEKFQEPSRPILDYEPMRFVTTGTFTAEHGTLPDTHDPLTYSAQHGTYSSKGTIDVGLKPSAGKSFEPLLHLRRGVNITPSASGPMLTTDGIISARTQGKVVDLMSGVLDSKIDGLGNAVTQKVLIPLEQDTPNSLTSSAGYAIAPDQALEWRVSNNKSFKASKLAIRDDSAGKGHLEMSGFLSFDVLHGAGIELTGNNHLTLTKEEVTAEMATGVVPLRTARNIAISKQHPLTLTLGGSEFEFYENVTMRYDSVTQEFKLSGKARVSFEAGHAELEFGKGEEDSFLYIKDGEFLLDKTKSALASEFAVGSLTFAKVDSTTDTTVTLDLPHGKLNFNKQRFKVQTFDDVPPIPEKKVIGFLPGAKRNEAQRKACDTRCSFNRNLGDREVYLGGFGPYLDDNPGPFSQEQLKEREEYAQTKREADKFEKRRMGFVILHNSDDGVITVDPTRGPHDPPNTTKEIVVYPNDIVRIAEGHPSHGDPGQFYRYKQTAQGPLHLLETEYSNPRLWEPVRIHFDTVELTPQEKAKLNAERSAFDAALGPRVEIVGELEWTLTRGLVERFSFPIEDFEIRDTGRDPSQSVALEIKNVPDADPKLKMRIEYEPESFFDVKAVKEGNILGADTINRRTGPQFRIRGGAQTLTHKRNGKTVATLNVGLDELVDPGGKRIATGSGIIITNGRVGAFEVAVRSLTVFEDNGTDPKLTFERDASSGVSPQDGLSAHYNPSSKELEMTGRAQLKKGANTANVDFGRPEDLKKSTIQERTILTQQYIEESFRSRISVPTVFPLNSASETPNPSGAGHNFVVYMPMEKRTLTGPIIVFYEVSGSATPVTDYAELRPFPRGPAPNSLLIPADRDFAYIDVIGVVDDRFVEENETIVVTLRAYQYLDDSQKFPLDSHFSAEIVIEDNEYKHTAFSSASGTDIVAYEVREFLGGSNFTVQSEKLFNTRFPARHSEGTFITNVRSDGFYHQGEGHLSYHGGLESLADRNSVRTLYQVTVDVKLDSNGNAIKDHDIFPTFVMSIDDTIHDKWIEEGLRFGISGVEITQTLDSFSNHFPKESLTIYVDGQPVTVEPPLNNLPVKKGLILGGMEVMGPGRISYPDTLVGSRPLPGYKYTSDGEVTLKFGDTELVAEQIIDLPLELDANRHLQLVEGARILFKRGQTINGITLTENLIATYQKPKAGSEETSGRFVLKGKGTQKYTTTNADGTTVDAERSVTIDEGRKPEGFPGNEGFLNLRIQNGSLGGTGIVPGTISVAGIQISTKGMTKRASGASGEGEGDEDEGEEGNDNIVLEGSVELDFGSATVTLNATLELNPVDPRIVEAFEGSFEVTDEGETCPKEDTTCERSAFTFGGVKITPSGTLAWTREQKNDEGEITEPEAIEIMGGADFEFEAKQDDDPVSFGVELELRIEKNEKGEPEVTKVGASFSTNQEIELFGLTLAVPEGGFSYDFKEEEFEAWGRAHVTTGTGDDEEGQTGTEKKESKFFDSSGEKKIEFTLGAFNEETGDVESPGLIIKDGKLELIDIETNTEGFKIFGVGANAKNLRITYSRSDSELVLTGGLELTVGKIGKFEGFTGQASFPGKGLTINTSTGVVEVRGLSVSASASIGPLSASASFTYIREDNGDTTISGEGEVTLPGGLTVGAGFELINGDLNAISVKVAKENPGIQIGNTGVFLTSIEGEIKGIANPDDLEVRVKVTGSLGPTVSIFGQTASLVKVSGELTFTKNNEETSLALTGTVQVLEGLVGEAEGTIKIYFKSSNNEFITIDANMRLLPGGIFQGELEFKLDRQLNMTFRSELAVAIPEDVPLVGGEKLGTFSVYMQIRPNDNDRRNDFAKVSAEVDLKVLEGRAEFEANFAGEVEGFLDGKVGVGFFSKDFHKDFSVQIGERNLVFLVPDTQGELDGFSSHHDAAEPELTIGEVVLDPDGPGGTVTFAGTSHLPDSTTIELFVDTNATGHNGHLLASGIAFKEGEQTYYWPDLAAFSSVPFDPSEKLYVYGRIYDGSNIPVDSNYSAAITPRDFSPDISLPGEHSFGFNQPLVFSSSQQNAISFSDPLADHNRDASLVVTLDVDHGNLTLDPRQATPWTNIHNATDVDGSGGTQVSDALQLVAMLNDPALQAAGGQLPSQRSTVGGTPMYDVNGDGKITAADAAALTDPLLNPETDTTSSFVAPNVIIVGAGTGRLQLIGTAVEINRMLDGLTYQSYEDSVSDDRLEVTVNRFPEFSFNFHTASIPLTARALTVGAPGGNEFLPLSYQRGSDAHLLSDVRIASAASGHIRMATIQIDGFDPETDVLGLVRFEQNRLGIDASFDSTTGTLYLTGSHLVERYQRAIALTTFSSLGSGQRTLRVHLGDRSSNVAEVGVAVQIIAMNQAPVVTADLGSTYVSGSTTAVSLLPSITVQDADSPTLRQAVITLDANSYHQGEDVLTYEAAGNITGRFNALTGQLVLSGQAGPNAWSAALSRVKYSNTQATAAPGMRQVSITVDDGNPFNSIGEAHQRLLVVAANTTLQRVAVGNLPTETATAVNRDGSITLAPELTLTAGSEAVRSLMRVEVAFTDNYIPGSDFLSTDELLTGMDSSYDAMHGVLTITGDVPADFYEFALQGVNYTNRSLVHDGLAREITFTVFDGFTESQSQSMTAQFEALPVVQAGMELLVYENGQSTHPLDPNISVMYADDMLTGASVEFVWDYLDDQDRLLFTNQNGITGSFDEANGVLTLMGTATVQQYQDALRSVEYTNTRTNPITSFKLLDVVVQDGNALSDPTYLLLVVNTAQVAPTVDVTATEVAYAEGNAPILVATDITIGERDEAHESGRGAVFLTGADIIVDGYVPGEDVLTFDAFESEPDGDGNTVVIIDGRFDVENGVLSLGGIASPEQYQTVLRSIRYENVSAAPSTHSRELLISVAQGNVFADAPPITVTVASLNDPPTRVDAPPASVTILKNAIVGSLGLEEIDYHPPHQQQPFVVVTVTGVPDAALGLIELSDETGFAIATVGTVYSLDQIRSAVFIPALNVTGTGMFEFTVAGWNPILEQPDPAHLTESVSIEVAGVKGLGISTTVYDFDHLADGSLAGQDGWVKVSAGGTMTVTSGVVSAAGDGQQMRPTDFGLSGDKITVTAQLTTRSGINGWQFGILHSEGTGAGSDFVFAVGNLGSNWRLRGGGFRSDRTAPGTGAAEITATLENYDVRLEIDLAAPSGSGAAQLFVNDALVIENPALGLTATSLDPATWSGIHLRHAGGATLDSLSFRSSGREVTPGAAFAAQAFRDLLGRNATLEELDALSINLPFEELSDEGLRRGLVEQLKFGREYGERVVTAAYQRLLNRVPTAQELDAVLDPEPIFTGDFTIFPDPIPLDAINSLIIGSDEYFTSRGGGTNEGFVGAAFADLLGRAPSDQELNEAAGGLQTGSLGRADIATQTEYSDEGAALVAEQLIGNLLRRAASSAEIEEVAGQIQQDGREAVLNLVVAAEEYYVRYGTQTSAESRSAEEIEAELILQWLQGTPTVGNSQVTTEFDAVGTINTDGRAHAGGTLIAPQYVLTAAHLVDGKDIDSLSFSVGLTSYGLDEVYVHPAYANEFLGTDAGNDIAILKLNRPVIDVEPAALWGGKLYLGDELTLVGFGPYPGDDGFGTKRAGTTPIDGLTRNLVTWTYDGADEATTVPGDSGSPQFVLVDGAYYVASLTSGGTHQALSLGDFAYNTRVAAYANWIDDVTNSQAIRSISERHGVSFTDSSLTGSFPSSFFTFNNNASVELSGSDLLIQDASINGQDNAFYISTTSSDVVISDAHQKLTTSIAGATGSTTHTITVPLSRFAGKIVVRSAGGDDVIDVSTPSRLVVIDAGAGLNRLIVNGSDADEAEEFFVRESNESLEVAMLTATTDGPYTVQATGIAHLELNTGAGDDTVRPQNLSGLTTSLQYFGLNLGEGDDMLDGVNGTISMVADGGDGNDSLIGGMASDWLQGGFGDDSLAGGPGNDTYVFDVDASIGFDTITEIAGAGSDTLDFSPTDFTSVGIDLRVTDAVQSVTINNALSLRLSGDIENVIGGSHGNVIIGDSGANMLTGGNGIDLILGGGGADQIFGGGSEDILQGSSDVLVGGDSADLTVFSGADIAFPTNLRPVFTIAGTAPGTDYDQVRVLGDGRSVTLGGELEVSLDLHNYTPQPGDQFTIVDLQAPSLVINGTFHHGGVPLNEGDSLTADGYRFSISYVAGDGNDISLTYVERPPGAEFDVNSDGDDVVVRQGATELLRVPGIEVEMLRIPGTPGNDTYNIGNLDAVFAGLVGGDAGAGHDTLRLTGSGQTLDLTLISNDLREFEVIDIRGSGNNSLKLSIHEVLTLSHSTDTLRVRYDDGDALEYGDGWTVEIPGIVDNQFVHILRQDHAKIEIDNTRPYHNPLRALDTNRDGSISPVDALIVINRIVDKGPGELDTPTSVADLTQFFYVDTNRDNSISPIDALIVINFLNDPARGSEGEAISAPYNAPVVSQHMSRVDAVSVFSNDEVDETVFAHSSPAHRLACAIQPPASHFSPRPTDHDEVLNELLADDSLFDFDDLLSVSEMLAHAKA